MTVPDAPNRPAISISGPAPRMTGDLIERAVPLLRGAAADLADELAVPDARGSGVLGADTREVLRAAGCSPRDIDDLVAAGAARVADTPAGAVRPLAEEP